MPVKKLLLTMAIPLMLKTIGLPGAWFAMWIAETAAMLYVLWAMRREMRKKVDPIAG